MRVLQRLAGRENPLTTLKVYEHTLHFRHGVAEIEHLTEREIIRLRAFGFRVERDTGPQPKTSAAPAAASPHDDAAGVPDGPPAAAEEPTAARGPAMEEGADEPAASVGAPRAAKRPKKGG